MKMSTCSTASPAAWSGGSPCADDRTLILFVFTRNDEPTRPHARLGGRRRGCCAEIGRRRLGMRTHSQRLDAAQELYFDPVAQIKMPAWSRGRVALVGDAAFCVSLNGRPGLRAFDRRGLRACRRARQSRLHGTMKHSRIMRLCCAHSSTGSRRAQNVSRPRSRRRRDSDCSSAIKSSKPAPFRDWQNSP